MNKFNHFDSEEARRIKREVSGLVRTEEARKIYREVSGLVRRLEGIMEG